MHRRLLFLSSLLIVAALAFTACSAPAVAPPPAGEEAAAESTAAATPEAVATPVAQATTAAPQSGDKERPAGWSEESHSNDVDPNYDVVFPIDAVNTITITIAPVATGDMSLEEYAAAVQAIVDYVELRAADVEGFLARQE